MKGHTYKQDSQIYTYDASVIDRFMCNVFGTERVDQINPFARFHTHVWELGKEVYITAKLGSQDLEKDILVFDVSKPAESQKMTCVLSDKARCHIDHAPASLLPRRLFKHPFNKTPIKPDLGRVSVFSVVGKHFVSNIPKPMGVRLNYEHPYITKSQKTRDADVLFNVFGSVDRAFFAMTPTGPNGQDTTSFGLRSDNHNFNNIEFVRTMAHVTESNLCNGIIHIPRNVCLEAKLSVFKGYAEPLDKGPNFDPKEYTRQMDEEMEKAGYKKTDHWVAIPSKHVLAWSLQSSVEHRRKVFRMVVFDYPLPENTLFYLVCDTDFDAMVRGFKRDWMNKVDRRKLGDVGVEFVPMLNVAMNKKEVPNTNNPVTGVAQMTFAMGYMTYPAIPEQAIATLAPTMSDNFPRYHDLWELENPIQHRLENNYTQPKRK